MRHSNLLFFSPIFKGIVLSFVARSSLRSRMSNGMVSPKTKSAIAIANSCVSRVKIRSLSPADKIGSKTITPPHTKAIIKILRKGILLNAGILLICIIYSTDKRAKGKTITKDILGRR